MGDRLSKRVLIIDPNPDIRQLLEIIAKKVGAEPLTASSIGEGKRVLDIRDIDLVICDTAATENDCENFVGEVHRADPTFPFVLFSEDRALPSKLRNDQCFVVPRFNFKLFEEVLQELLLVDGGAD